VKPRPHYQNAIFNLAGGASSAGMALVLPFLLNRFLSQADYAIWVLGFQAALYVPMFGLGVHQLLNRAIASSLARQELESLHQQVAAGFWMILLLSLLALSFVWISSFFVEQIARTSTVQEGQIRAVWLFVGTSAALGLGSLFFFGCFGGQQRYEWENTYKVIIASSFLGLIVGSWYLGFALDPFKLSLCYGLTIAAGLVFLSWRFRSQSQLRLTPIARWHFPSLKSYVHGMYGLGVWQIGMLMVSGFDLWIVAKCDFAAVPGYSIALSFLVFVSGSMNAIAGPLLPRFAAQLSKSDPNSGHLFFQTQFRTYQKKLLGVLAFLLIVLLLVPQFIWQWALKESASTFVMVFPILLLATCIRLSTLLYGLTLVSANLQHRVILSPLLEGVINVIASLVLASYLGPIGVAWGTLLGALVCVLMHALYNVPRTSRLIPLTPKALLCPWIS